MGSTDTERSESDAEGSDIELGFLRQLDAENSWRLHRCYFPSKLGGKPAWLDPQNIPSFQEMICSCCGKPLVFLLQIYAPNDDNDAAFHRTVFVFCCKTEDCYKTNSNQPFRVFRCQLRRENVFYESTPPDYESPSYFKSCKDFTNTCEACGSRGDKFCSRCHKVTYCCKEHQKQDWKKHKASCGKPDGRTGCIETAESLLFPEKEMLIECQEIQQDDDDSADQVCSNPGRVHDGNFSPSELEQFANISVGDEQFSAFQEKISRCSDQVLRYDRGGEPLWCSSENQLKAEEVPKCHCGSPRQFEFQVMPQLLNHLTIQTTIEEPSIDWGILAVYTCSQDCTNENTSYFQEYLHRQDFSRSSLV